MREKPQARHRTATNQSLHAERQNADRELARRVATAQDDADAVLRLARARADRLMEATRAAADARLPLSEQTVAAVDALLKQRANEDHTIENERQLADGVLRQERDERRQDLVDQLALERRTTDVRLELERLMADSAIASRDDFLAQASHDLRGFMAAQKIFLSLLVKETTATEAVTDPRHMAALLKIEEQMARLVADLTDVAAIEAGKLAVIAVPESALALISAGLTIFEPLARERAQGLTLASDRKDVLVLADKARCVQVLGNLLSNAIKFTPHGGRISVGFEVGEEEAHFFVADTGPGVPPERARAIFERFVGSKGQPSGLGLGLFIASGIVEAHGGRLWCEPAQSSGCVFRFTLPLHN